MKKVLNYILNIPFIFKIVCSLLPEKKNDIIQMQIFRNNFMFFGLDLSNMTDDEIKENVCKVGKVFGDFGLTTNEAAKALKSLSLNV